MLRIPIALQQTFVMKTLLLSLFLILASSSVFVGCTPRQAGAEDQPQGISADTGYDRDRIYDWQDRTFRQLAY